MKSKTVLIHSTNAVDFRQKLTKASHIIANLKIQGKINWFRFGKIQAVRTNTGSVFYHCSISAMPKKYRGTGYNRINTILAKENINHKFV